MHDKLSSDNDSFFAAINRGLEFHRDAQGRCRGTRAFAGRLSAPAAMVDARVLEELGAATLGESGARRMHPRVKPAWPGAHVAGPAYPVRCSPGDNLGIHVAVTRAPAGSVLVADMGGARDFGYWGEVLTTGAEARGIAGLVIDGCVRDGAALAAHGFPVFSTGLALTGATKEQPGSVGAAGHRRRRRGRARRLGRRRRRRRRRGPRCRRRRRARRRAGTGREGSGPCSRRSATARPRSSSSASTRG